jgi:hypothetical protein
VSVKAASGKVAGHVLDATVKVPFIVVVAPA